MKPNGMMMVIGGPKPSMMKGDDGEGYDEEGPSKDLELSAAKDAMAAKSPEEWVSAMKAFGEACGWKKRGR